MHNKAQQHAPFGRRKVSVSVLALADLRRTTITRKIMKTILSTCATLLLPALMLCSLANAQDDIRSKPLVLPTPSDSHYTVERNVVYRDSEGGRTLADMFLPSDSDGKHP